MRMCLPPALALAATLAVAAQVGCKKESNSSAAAGACGTAAGGGSGSGSGGTAAATGAGAVSVAGNVAAYQDIHVTVPWSLSDPAALAKPATDAAAGRGLRLTDGTTTLEIASDGRSVRLNGRPYGGLNPHDRVVLTKDGKLTVNGAERPAETAPEPPPATSPAGMGTSGVSGH